jgi:hypothetical protein
VSSYLFVYTSFNGAEYTAFIDWMIVNSEVEGRCHGPIKVVSLHWPGGREDMVKLSLCLSN